jgi:acetyl-CoA carboxylase alpha subunit
MKHFKDITAVFDLLESIAVRNDIEPEQKRKVEAAVELVKELRRARNLSKPAVFDYVQRIAEKLIEAFRR